MSNAKAKGPYELYTGSTLDTSTGGLRKLLIIAVFVENSTGRIALAIFLVISLPRAGM